MESQDVMKDVAAPTSDIGTTPEDHSAKSESTSPAEESKWTTAYFTEGELLPWKGRWWRVKLVEANGEKFIALVAVKPTRGSEKRLNSEGKRRERHNGRPGVIKKTKWVEKLTASVGAAFSSREFSRELQSTGALQPPRDGRS